MRKNLVVFTKHLSELLSAGIPVERALCSLSQGASLPKAVRRSAQEISASLRRGSTVSFALENCAAMKFPPWYASFVAVAEENGSVAPTMAWLCALLSDNEKSAETFVGATVYPLSVSLLALLSSVFVVRFASSSFFSADAAGAYADGAWKSVWASGAGFFLFVSLFVLFLFRLLRPSPLIVAVKALSFLLESGVPLVQAIDGSLPVAAGGKVGVAMARVRHLLLNGECASAAFFRCFSEAGFSFAAKVVSEHLSLCEQSGQASAFTDSAAALEAHRKKRVSAAFALEQPLLLMAAAAYFVVLLKRTMLPILLGFIDL